MIRTIEWTDDGVVMIDQRMLPNEEIYNTYQTVEEVAEAIETRSSGDRSCSGHGNRPGH